MTTRETYDFPLNGLRVSATTNDEGKVDSITLTSDGVTITLDLNTPELWNDVADFQQVLYQMVHHVSRHDVGTTMGSPG